MGERQYCEFASGSLRGFAAFEERGAIVPALVDRTGCARVDALGRGALYRFESAGGPVILREYRRGGALQKLLREGSLTNRPRGEWNVLLHLYGLGLPVPEPMGVAWRHERGIYTGAIATRAVAGVDLIAYLKDAPEHREALLLDAGRAIRSMHDNNVFHADLHVGNFFVAQNGHEERPILLDFDKARITALTDNERARNLLRLRRSFVKHGLRLSDFERILRGYGLLSWPRWLEFLYDIRAQYSDARAAQRHAR